MSETTKQPWSTRLGAVPWTEEELAKTRAHDCGKGMCYWHTCDDVRRAIATLDALRAERDEARAKVQALTSDIAKLGEEVMAWRKLADVDHEAGHRVTDATVLARQEMYGARAATDASGALERAGGAS